MPRKSNDTVAVVGIDIGKNVFHLIGLNKRGAIVLRQKLSRGQLEARLANMPPCLIGMEACVGAHDLSRKLKALGHDPRLMPAKYVKAFLKGNKNDFRDARRSPRLCRVRPCASLPPRPREQLDLQALRATLAGPGCPAARHPIGEDWRPFSTSGNNQPISSANGSVIRLRGAQVPRRTSRLPARIISGGLARPSNPEGRLGAQMTITTGTLLRNLPFLCFFIPPLLVRDVVANDRSCVALSGELQLEH